MFTGKPKIRTKRVKHKWITGIHKPCLRIKWVSCNGKLTSGAFECTPEHRVLTKSMEWVEARFLNPGDCICRMFYDEHGKRCFDTTCKIMSIAEAGKHTVYDIEVERYHNFFADSVCVHNSSQNPNLQNIPSRHTDIRHMFRATPEKEEVTDCQEFGNEIVITLNNLDVVYKQDGTETQVRFLQEGDCVELLEDKEVRYLSVKSISNSPPYSTIRFNR